MPVTTKGHLLVKPIGIKTNLALSDLLAAVGENLMEPPGMDQAWGSVHDETEGLSRTGEATYAGGQPEILAETDWHPERLAARFYWREVDRRALRLLGDSAPPPRLQTLEAVDVYLSRTSQKDEYLGLLTARNANQIRSSIIPGIYNTLRSHDGGVSISTESSPMDLLDEDFFRWLLFRAHEKPELSPSITLRALREINGQDTYLRPTAISRGVDVDRPELLALIMASRTQFGPAKMAIDDDDLKLTADFELHLDGGFSAVLGNSMYEHDMARAEKGTRMLHDLAYKVIPEITDAYYQDADWKTHDRQASIDKARAALRAALDRLDLL